MSPMKANTFRRCVLAVLTAIGLTLTGLTAQGSALAAVRPSAAPGQQAAQSSHRNSAPVRRACPAAKPGDAACLALVRTNVRGHLGTFAAGIAPTGYGPSELQNAYKLPSATAGAGQTVAVVDAYDDPTAATDLNVYRAQYGLPPCTAASGCFRKVNQQGQQSNYPQADAVRGWAAEESLDIDMVSAICPRCHILLVEADNNTLTNLGQAVDEAVALGAKYVSNSYAGVEYSGVTTGDAYYDHPGVAITAAAGDSGYNNQNAGADAPSWPATSEYVAAVGGTTLTRDPGTPRGWSEAAWGGGGSGCSLFEAKPPWQHDPGCGANHMTADVSADADPATGVAVYDSYSEPGWLVLGGTSVSSPIIASVYALAGPPAVGSYPASYPYANPSSLNDISYGANAAYGCGPDYGCTAGPGYDGPTGLGTPDGVAAFFAGQRGTITGTITSTTTGKPVAGAQVEAGGLSVNTGSSGHYTLSVPAGTYTVTASDLDYATATASKVKVGANHTATMNIRLRPVPTVTVSGKVTDGSGHSWPLLARVSVAGSTAVTYTNPATGQYSLALPENSVHTLAVDPVYPGYVQTLRKITTTTAGLTQNLTVPVDASACTAPGYKYDYQGTTQTFDASTSLPSGWTVVNKPRTIPGWQVFPPSQGNATSGTGNFVWTTGGADETSLYTPVTNLSKDRSPVLQFLWWYGGVIADGTGGIYVDLSTDGGKTWHTVWKDFLWVFSYSPGTQQLVLRLPQAAGKSQVQIRFRYVDRASANGWELDNIFLGNRSCAPSVRGGLVEGSVTDANTDRGIAGADITSTASTQDSVTSAPVPGDPALGDGFYSLFSPQTGSEQFKATSASYISQTATADVTANSATQADFSLAAGQLTATPDSLSATQQLGASTTRQFTLKNTGTAPVTLNLGEQPGTFTLAGQRSAARAAPAASGWASLPAYPAPVQNNLVTTDPATGDVYSIGGDVSGLHPSATVYVLRPGASSWAALPDMPGVEAFGVGGFVNGKLYVVGGYAQFWNGAPVWIYDPVTQHWSTGAYPPGAEAWGSAAVLDGKIYTVQGDVEVYDPARNTWSFAADYPGADSFTACGGFNGELYCAGGLHKLSTPVKSAYAYNPATDTWSAIDPLPAPLGDGAYAAANGKLLVSGGYTQKGSGTPAISSKSYSYMPGKGWTTLPALPTALRNTGSGCGPDGLYAVGGYGPDGQTASAEVLRGYGNCGSGTDVPWLSVNPTASTTLQPGQSTTATVTLNAGDPSVTQPGTYTAQVVAQSNTPYTLSVPVTMTVTPPKTWGKISGTVTDASTGNPIAGATVQVCTLYDKTTGSCGAGSQTYTLTTDANGDYGLWLDRQGNPLRVTVSDTGYVPQVKTAKITAGRTTTVNVALKQT